MGTHCAPVDLRVVQSEVSQLYVALFGRAPARLFYPAGLAPVEVVASLYRNVLGR